MLISLNKTQVTNAANAKIDSLTRFKNNYIKETNFKIDNHVQAFVDKNKIQQIEEKIDRLYQYIGAASLLTDDNNMMILDMDDLDILGLV